MEEEQRMTIYRGRPMSPIEAQVDMMKSHVTRGADRGPKRDGERTLQLAVPAGWSRQAKCIGDFARYDEIERMKAGQAAELCAGCPVIAECLSSAMDEEHGLSSGNRYGVRGGLSPKERAAIAFADRECERGHVGRWRGQLNAKTLVCLECKAEDERERRKDPEYRARKLAQAKARDQIQRVSCLACRPEMRTLHFARHLAIQHGEEFAA